MTLNYINTLSLNPIAQEWVGDKSFMKYSQG
jgi:hypothetical protein